MNGRTDISTRRSPASDDADVDRIVLFGRATSDPNRVRILLALGDGERSVCDLAGHLSINQPTTSHHLGVLQAHRLVARRRDGKQVFYRLADATAARVSACGPIARAGSALPVGGR